MNLIETGIEKGLIRFDEDRNSITYIHQNKKRNYNNPEGKVQAEAFLTFYDKYREEKDHFRQLLFKVV